MSNQATNTAAAAAPAKAKKPSIVDTFLKGCAKGFKVGIENITPAMILGYVLVYILKETGLMDISARSCRRSWDCSVCRARLSRF
mgnify:CR=1 FL=1